MKNKKITSNNLEKVEGFIARIEEMQPKEYKKWVESLSRFHQYSLSNKVLLALAGASQVAGFKQWQKRYDRKVKKGAKAIWILAPMIKKSYFVNGTEVKYKKYKEAKKAGKSTKVSKGSIIGYKSVPVFDISDTEGEPVKNGMTDKSEIDFWQVEKTARALGYRVEKQPLEVAMGGYITAEEKHIVINSNLSEAENTATLIHELAHGELGHNDSKDNRASDIHELEAETATYIVCDKLGIDRKSDFYCKSWTEHKGTKPIRKALEKILKVAEKLQEGIKKQELNPDHIPF
jgi:hypothetical protein